MGLKLRYNLFHNTSAEAVYGTYVSFYKQRGRPFQLAGYDLQQIDFHVEKNGWVVVSLDCGWEWTERRQAQLFVSERLSCPGFLVFVYDGDYWGYEFFNRGQAIDHFVQESTGIPIGFPGEDCRGNPEIVAQHLPFLHRIDVAAYLQQMTEGAKPKGLNIPARPGDEFNRFDECAVVDFLRMLGIPIELRDGYVRVNSPVYRSVFNSTWNEQLTKAGLRV